MVYCVFNPITGAHRLIPYPEPTTFMMIGEPGLAVYYHSSDHYKLVTISKMVENSNLFYKFHVLSSVRSGLWHEIPLKSNTFSDLAVGSRPVYWRGSLYWLRSDGSVIAFDTNREEGIILDRPEFIDDFGIIYGKLLTGRDMWLGVAQGSLTLVCIFKKSIVIAAYEDASSSWNVFHPLDNFLPGPDGFINGFPIMIDNKQVFFAVKGPLSIYHDLYEYDTEINWVRKAAGLGLVDYPLHSFQPTLASVHATPSEIVNSHHFSYITAKIDQIRRYITEGVSTVEEEDDESSSEEEEESDEEIL
ncbi:putative F-box/kelch-repeat protein At1g20790 [Lycium barbarum]|uniref:putative F-box/kelch-repeat protein At1g20790 n=1 Tax=Lycium barbarum TaxID=112863 RepID=UPI00293EC5C0|nr:putative F-box/kelch-repeat protein At1g20790 [Lycium barbarum]